MLIHVDSLYLVVFVEGLSDERHAGVGKVLDFLWCGAGAGSAFVADKAVAGFGEGLFRGGAPLGWFSAEQPMYGSRLPFGIQRDEGGSKDFSDLAAQTELGTVRTDLHNQSRVKGLA